MSVSSTSLITSTLSPPRNGSGHDEHRLQHAVGRLARRLIRARTVEAPDRQAAEIGLAVEDLRLRPQSGSRLRPVDPDVLGLENHSCSCLGTRRDAAEPGHLIAGFRGPHFSAVALYVNPLLPRASRPGGGYANVPTLCAWSANWSTSCAPSRSGACASSGLWFTDVLGFLKSVEITPAELEVALEEGMTFDGSTIEGYSRIQESDMLAKPDPNTFELLPGGDADAPVARMFCDVQVFSGDPFHGDPRYVLKRNLERAREKGFTFFVGPEMEFFYSRTGRRDGAPRRRRLLRPHRPRPRLRSCASRPCSASRRWASRSSTRSTRTVRASTRSTSATPTRSRWPTT